MWRWIAVVTLVCAVATGLFVFRWIGRAGASDLENWIGHYLVSIGQEYLKPEISLVSIDYRYPRTVVITGLALITDGIPILSVDQAWLELEETPRPGQPLLIREVRLVSPAVQLVTAADTGLPIGWSDLIRDEVKANPVAPPAGYRVSDFLRMRRATIESADFTYDAADGSPPMALRGIDFGLNATAHPDAPGAYEVAGSLSQPKLGALSLRGVLDLDASELRLVHLGLVAALDEFRYPIFPPAAQAWLRDHRVVGTLALNAEGMLPLTAASLDQADLRFDVELTETRFAAGAGLLQCPRLETNGAISNGVLIAKARAELLGGALECDVRWDFATAGQTEFHARFRELDLSILASLLAKVAPAHLAGFQPRGRLAGAVDASTREWRAAEWRGSASLTVLAPAVNINGVTVSPEQVTLNGEFGPGRVEGCARAVWNDGSITADGAWNRDPAGRLRVRAQGLALPISLALSVLPPGEMERIAPVRPEGRVSIEANADIPLGDWRGAEVSARLKSDWLRITLPGGHVSATSIAINGDWREQAARLRLACAAFDGQIEGTAGFSPQSGRVDVDVTARDLHMDQLPLELIANSPVDVVSGRASGNVSGAVIPNDLAGSDLDFHLRCDDGQAAVRGLLFPTPRADCQISLRDRRLGAQAQLELLGGKASAAGSLNLDRPRELRADWRADGVRLERIIERRDGASAPRYRGIVSGSGVVNLNLDHLPDSLGGAGEVRVTQGKLVNLPVLGDLFALIAGHLPFPQAPDTDHGTARFSFHSDRMRLREFDVACLFLAIRGDGDAYYDGRLDLTLQAGPLTRVEKLLGPLRRLFQQISDRLVRYHVTGTTSQPVFEVEAFGVKPDFRGLTP